jgi:hypothetical protein
MHQAMIRRIALEECDAALRDRLIDISILWSNTETLSDWNQWSQANQADVIIADCDRLVDAMETVESLSSATLLATGEKQCLRLVWRGLDGSMDDLCWSTEWLASGVIADAVSLRSWIRSAVRHARTIPKPPHPFLQNLD